MAAEKLKVADIIKEYPDCPQREMALRAFRKGHFDAADEWLASLSNMIEEGRAAIERDRLVDTKRRA